MLSAALLAAAAIAGSGLPPCTLDQLSLAFDDEGGAFDGMQHSGALLVIRNRGPGACATPSLPTLIFLDSDGKSLPIVRRAPRYMHPGPVMTPVGVAEGAEVTAALRWVSGPAFEPARCFKASLARVSLQIGSLNREVAFSFCAPQNGPANFDQPPLRPDPVLTPKPSTAHDRGD